MEKIVTEVTSSSFSNVNDISMMFSGREMEKCWIAWKVECPPIPNNNNAHMKKVESNIDITHTQILKLSNLYQRDHIPDKAVNTKSDLLW